MKQKNEFKILVTPIRLYMGIAACIVVLIACIYMIVAINNGFYIKSESEKFGMQMSFAALGAAYLLVTLSCFPRWWVSVSFDKKAVTYKQAFHKPCVTLYEEFLYVYRASCKYITIKSADNTEDFIILSKQQTKEDDLKHIDRMRCREDYIKIKYSTQNYNLLKKFLPKQHLNKLENNFYSINIDT